MKLTPALRRFAPLLAALAGAADAAPSVSRLTPPSELFASGNAAPVIARFLPGQRFDLQATLRPDDAAKSITAASFMIDGKPVVATVALRSCASGKPRAARSQTRLSPIFRKPAPCSARRPICLRSRPKSSMPSRP